MGKAFALTSAKVFEYRLPIAKNDTIRARDAGGIAPSTWVCCSTANVAEITFSQHSWDEGLARPPLNISVSLSLSLDLLGCWEMTWPVVTPNAGEVNYWWRSFAY